MDVCETVKIIGDWHAPDADTGVVVEVLAGGTL